ncbi:hypothetical protein BDZ89DRAFT_1065118 [Hymenopellis radicata]|nr:hypothetical protein BDZ89DRAFT_1065118 [Hymenopellis radicata]
MPDTKSSAASGSSKQRRSDKDDASAAALARVATFLQQATDAAKAVKNLPPAGVADLRRARSLAAALLDTLPPDPALEQIKILEYKGRIDALLSMLRSSCAVDGQDGYADQLVCMDQICTAISSWLPIIWNAFESGADLRLVRASIVCCNQTVDAMWELCEIRASGQVNIKSAAGEIIFKSSDDLSDALNWFWRELLIFDARQKSDPSSSTILADLKNLRMAKSVFELLASDGENTADLFNKHWTPEMHEVARKLLKLRI